MTKKRIIEEAIHEYEIGNTIYTVRSHFKKEAKEGLVSRLVRLIKRDVEGLNDD